MYDQFELKALQSERLPLKLSKGSYIESVDRKKHVSTKPNGFSHGVPITTLQIA